MVVRTGWRITYRTLWSIFSWQGSIIQLTLVFLNAGVNIIWAASWQNQQNGMCTQWRLRSAWASAQSDQSSLCAQWVAKDPSLLHADSEDSDQAGRMPRLIWVFAGRTCHFVGFVMRQFILPVYNKYNYKKLQVLWQSQVLFWDAWFYFRQNKINFITIMILSFWTGWSVQTVSALFAIPSALFGHITLVNPHCSVFRVITAIFSDVWFFFIFMVILTVSPALTYQKEYYLKEHLKANDLVGFWTIINS